jgi:hypothetical protein
VNHEREFLRLAEALAEWPELLDRLLHDHDEVDVCSGCTVPGGRNVIMAPCAPRTLAVLARRRYRSRAIVRFDQETGGRPDRSVVLTPVAVIMRPPAAGARRRSRARGWSAPEP